MRQVVLDTETTGLSPKNGDRIIEIGCVEIINRKVTGNVFHSYCNPERLNSSETIAITGITDEFLVNQPKFREIAAQFLNFINNAELIIHNASFDLEFLNYELNLLHHNPAIDLSLQFTVIDTLAMARRMHPGQRNNLDALCKRYNVNNEHRELHGALKDANILAAVFLKMTAGQIVLDFSLPEQDEKHKDTLNNKQLKVIYANQFEQQLHEEYLKMLQV